MCASVRSCVDDSSAVRNRDAQHRRVLLDVEAVLQPQRPELVLGQLAGEEAPRLVAELRDALVDDALVEVVVAVHVRRLAYAKATAYKAVAIIGKNIES